MSELPAVIDGTPLAQRPAAEVAWAGWQYEDFVRAGQEVASRSAWMLGDLAAAVDTQYGENTLGRYAEDIGLPYDSLIQYRRVALLYPAEICDRSQISYSVALVLAAQPDRLELAESRQWTKAQARELVASRHSPRLPTPDRDAGRPDEPSFPEPEADEDMPSASGTSAARDRIGRPLAGRASRQALPEFAKNAGWSLRADIEKVERIFADDRFTQNREQVAAQLRGHLTYALQVCQDLVNRLDGASGEAP